MCGIAGKFVFGKHETVPPALLKRMCDALHHRGPDEEGFHFEESVGLGHRRLSIIDLAAGQQPLCNEDGTVWIVFNGEIYNYVELREDLIKKGHTLRTSSDTEVIVHLYEEYQEDFVRWLRGMFGLAIWDRRQKKLVLARDRMGKKPLYYAVLPGRGLLFGSEIKAILQDSQVSREIDLVALDAYLSLLYVPSPMTIFKGIQKLPAGHIAVCTAESISVREYWDVPCLPPYARSESELLEELDSILRESVKIRLRSDVPLGAFLSGGVDSTSVVTYMSDALDRPVVTCSVGFNDPAHDELVYAKEVAGQRRCEHHEDVVQPNIAELVPKLARLFDEPFADSSAVPTYYVSEMARRHVTVALSGDGGDELFAGYSRHGLQCLEARLRGMLGSVGTHALAKVASWLPAMKGRNTLRKLGMTPDASYALKHAGYVFSHDRKMQMNDASLRSSLRDCDPAATFRKLYDRCEATDPLTKALYVDLKTYLVDDILVKVDRMSMAHALEVRAPLLDQNFVEFVMRLPRSLKLNGRTTKVALKMLLNGRVPEKIVNRKKHGFTMPLGATLRGPLDGMVRDTLLSPRFRQRGYFDPDVVKGMCEEHASGTHDHADRIWTLLMFELWHREYLDVHDVHAAA